MAKIDDVLARAAALDVLYAALDARAAAAAVLVRDARSAVNGGLSAFLAKRGVADAAALDDAVLAAAAAVLKKGDDDGEEEK